MVKYFIFLLIIFKNVHSSDISSSFDSIQNDPLNRINNHFIIPSFLLNRTKFWYNIYSKYHDKNIIIHDKKNPNIIFEVLDFSNVYKSKLNRFTNITIQKNLIKGKIKAIATFLKINVKKKRKRKLISFFKKYKIPFKSRTLYKKALLLAENIRAQTGQKNNINNGFKSFLKNRSFFNSLFTIFKIPEEFIAIPFLESSFNSDAQSKVGAKGAWQFMDYVGKSFFVQNKLIDHRLNIYLSSIGAMQLIRQNYRILKRYDLSVIAYNSGLKHLFKAKRKLKKNDLMLKDLFFRYKHPGFGFASINFISEFLALVYLLKYNPNYSIDNLNNQNNKIFFYTTLCKTIPKKLFSNLSSYSKNLNLLNKHILNKDIKHNKGLVFITDFDFKNKNFKKINTSTILKTYPRYWHRIAHRYNCSIK